MTIKVGTETVHCDHQDCTNEHTLVGSVADGWYFTITKVNADGIGTYTDYCPEHAAGRRLKITLEEKR